MRVAHLDAGRSRGASLLEVLIALSLLATSILGAAAAQLSALRYADEQMYREQASWAAASIAEAMRAPDASMHALAREKERAVAVLPGAQVSVVDEANGIGSVVVEWAPGHSALGQKAARGFGSCTFAEGVEGGSCTALPFVSGR